jgi:hypothetical protein
MFHDIGLNERFHASGRRFEVHGAAEARRFLQAAPERTFDNVKADMLAHREPRFQRGDFVRTILDSPWAE